MQLQTISAGLEGGVVITIAIVKDNWPRIPTIPGRSDIPCFRRLNLRFMRVVPAASDRPCVATPNEFSMGLVRGRGRGSMEHDQA